MRPAVDCGSVSGMQHDLVDEADAGVDRQITAHVAADVKAARVVLYYRPESASDFVEVPMTKVGECSYTGTIPGDKLRGEYMHYYVAALNTDGKVVASRGSAGSPNIIEIRAGAAAGGGALADDDENPLAGGSRRDDDGDRESDRDGDVAGAVDVAPKRARFFVNLAVGSGGGYVTGETESTQQSVGCCFAPALFHVAPEIGYLLDARSSLSLAFRVGFPVGANIPGHSTGAPAALVRYRRAFAKSGDGLGISASIGGGVLRNTVKLANPSNPAEDTDTVAIGPLLVGAGAAYTASLGGPMKFVAEANALAGIPVISEFSCAPQDDGTDLCVRPNFGVNVDVTVGLLFAF
ncbi:MAG: hypothetical protein D6689_21475 [Deltaproteobacteria bacterium]|nr:MAG: hypothetical protein D6689_21475 [Deltaproteobacteria bacterium]